ncbi:MAG TPA: hypothetical protein VM432_02650 [Bdellovibrionales bacterium]|jgi:hypothetical protein|nr:hypothetical protein [Bdellovibrionales bacterium]
MIRTIQDWVIKQWNQMTLPWQIAYGVTAWILLFILIHGTWTLRANHQRMFAYSVAKKIAIQGITARAKSDVLYLEGTGTKEQKAFAEKMAELMIEKHSAKAINPPTEIKNNIKVRRPTIIQAAKPKPQSYTTLAARERQQKSKTR